jgi:hypothetical protein
VARDARSLLNCASNALRALRNGVARDLRASLDHNASAVNALRDRIADAPEADARPRLIGFGHCAGKANRRHQTKAPNATTSQDL